jgi:hypothetical protein
MISPTNIQPILDPQKMNSTLHLLALTFLTIHPFLTLAKSPTKRRRSRNNANPIATSPLGRLAMR